MSITITQSPAEVNLAQSPMIFTVSESSGVIQSSSFQYVCDLYYWGGSPNASGSIPQYQLVKYPNQSGVGIFDISRIINSALTASAEQDKSNVKYAACDFYWQYWNGSSYVTAPTKVRSLRHKGIDGYATFQEPIGQAITSKSLHWPIMSSGPTTQSFNDANAGYMTVYTGYAETFAVLPDRVKYTSQAGTADILVSGSLDTQSQTQYFPIGPSCTDFPVTAGEWYTIQAYNNTTPLGIPIRFEYSCPQKYPNIRVKWKNKFGQFDYFNFDMINRKSFSTTNRSYQPQIGSWESSTLSYQDYESSNLNYIVDSAQSITVNTNWIDEEYNDIIKQLLVSEEIYWVQVQQPEQVFPITIATNTIQFKTGVNDKLIQYQFDFNFGQGYKLIL